MLVKEDNHGLRLILNDEVGSMQKLSLSRRFTVLSLVAFVITGLALGVLISKHFKNEMLNNFRDSTILLFDTTIKPELVPSEFAQTFSIGFSSELDNRVKDLIINAAVENITIWNREGDFLYSSKSSVTARKVNDRLLNSALKNKVQVVVTSPGINEIGNSSAGKVIRVYAPIILNNQVLGAFEIDKSYGEVEMHLFQLNKLLVFVMFAGLLILYIFLLKTIANASTQIIKQNKTLLVRENELQESYGKLNATYKSTVLTLSKAVDARDSYTAGHSERVAKLSKEIGQRLGLSVGELETLELAALFHDIGKLGVPDSILNKPGKLSSLEYAKVKEHPVAGVEILKNIDFLGTTLNIIKHHHERFSGGGYPDGIRGEAIPLGSRIIAVADTYDAITSDRPYRKGLSHQEAIEELIRSVHQQFDPNIVGVFLEVRLTNCPTNNVELKAI